MPRRPITCASAHAGRRLVGSRAGRPVRIRVSGGATAARPRGALDGVQARRRPVPWCDRSRIRVGGRTGAHREGYSAVVSLRGARVRSTGRGTYNRGSIGSTVLCGAPARCADHGDYARGLPLGRARCQQLAAASVRQASRSFIRVQSGAVSIAGCNCGVYESSSTGLVGGSMRAVPAHGGSAPCGRPRTRSGLRRRCDRAFSRHPTVATGGTKRMGRHDASYLRGSGPG